MVTRKTLKRGDKVRVLDGSNLDNYCDGWSCGMTKYVGTTCTVIGFEGPRGILLEGNIFTWDVRGLELVEEAKMENKIILNGVEYTLSAELAEKLMAEVTEQKAQKDLKSPLEREEYDTYYFISSIGTVNSDVDDRISTVNAKYDVGNYCRDKELMVQRSLHETLNRLLWRYRETNGGGEKRGGHFIYLSGSGDMYVGHCTYAGCGDVYFKTKAVAEAAIEEVVKPFMAEHHGFVW